MKFIPNLVLAGILSVLSIDLIYAQESYQPLPPTPDPRALQTNLSLANLGPECDTPPSLDSVRHGLFRTRTFVISTNIAAHLGNVFQIFKASGSVNGKVLIHETSQSAVCLAKDGETSLEYGYAFRVAFSTSHVDGSAELTIPALAASATLSNQEGEIIAGLWGIDDDAARTLVAKFASLDLGVETFAQVRDTLKQAVASVSAANIEKISVTRLGALNIPESNPIEMAVVTTFALKQIARRKSCDDSTRNITNLSHKSRIVELYTKFQGNCSRNRPTSNTANNAKSQLMEYF